jgi:hypothetical protein
MRKFNLSIFRSKPQVREQSVPVFVAEALQLLRIRMLNYEVLRAAVNAVLSGEEAAIKAYCEDYGLDQLDPVKLNDVLRHAMKIIDERR